MQTVLPDGVVEHTVVVVIGTVVGGAGTVVGGVVGTVVCTVVGGAGAVVGVVPAPEVGEVVTVVVGPEPVGEPDAGDAPGDVDWCRGRDPAAPARVVVVRPGAEAAGEVAEVRAPDDVEGAGGAAVVVVDAACAT